MPLEETELFSSIKLPKLAKLLMQTCSVWLRLQLCHRPVDDQDDYDHDDSGLWEAHRRRRLSAKPQPPKRRGRPARTQRFPPFHCFVSSLLSVGPDWCSDVECPSVKLSRREQQELKPRESLKAEHISVNSRIFYAFPCSCNSSAALDKTLLSSRGDKRNMVTNFFD